MQTQIQSRSSWLDRAVLSASAINWETVIFGMILILAFFSRFYILGARTMSHDETSHVYFSWLYEQGNGYSHDPVTHGPLQFHMVAFTYFMFGDNDFTARIPAALFSIATVYFMWHFRRYLGRAGAIAAAILMLISPYMLYYGRYVRNEAFVALFGAITLWGILRYLETGANRYLYWVTIATVLHFTSKETSFIYTAQALIFLAVYLIKRLIQLPWQEPEWKRPFLVALIITVLFVSVAGGLFLVSRSTAAPDEVETAIPAVPGQEDSDAAPVPRATPPILPTIFIGLSLVSILSGAYFVLRGYSWQLLRSERSFGLLAVLGGMVLPMLAPFPVKFLGFNPIDYNNPTSIAIDIAFVVLFTIIAILIGILWNPRLWLINGAIFYAIFTVFYTSIFSNGFGFVTGLVGSLGYWLEQQGVNRGSQPFYYYGLIQIPVYEFLPAIGTIAAFFYAIFPRKKQPMDRQRSSDELPADVLSMEPVAGDVDVISVDETYAENPQKTEEAPTIGLLLFWSVSSLLAYSLAGEKMPWLTVHIALPMILAAAWFIGKTIDEIDWRLLLQQRGILVILFLPIFFTSMSAAIGQWLGSNPPFQGKELTQLQASSTFLTAALTALGCAAALSVWIRSWSTAQFQRVVSLTILGLLGLLTARAAFRASYINYDHATEYLVYAHMARGPKEALEQLEELSQRTTNGLGIRVGYDDETTYPYWWYLRNFPNKDFFGKAPTRAQRDDVAILVGDPNYGKIEPVVGQAYTMFEYTRIWWPNQAYFGLTWQSVLDAISDPLMREAIFKIWLNRDYTLFSQLTNEDMSLPNWQPSHKFRLYVRKDVISSLWNYGVAPAEAVVVADPYEGKQLSVTADRLLGTRGAEPGQLQRPRGVAVASDGSVYIADTENHRIQHLSPDGSVLQVWGSFGASSETTPAQEGLFNEPWGIALGPDGSVYVADTWNHRIQKFTPDGKFIRTWGFGISQTEDPFGFYGPRAVAVNAQGHVFVTDTGNKRIVVFDSDGNFLTKFGETGLELGQFDEPVGLAVDSAGMVYVADTWNQRIQVFAPADDGTYYPLNSWDVVGWYGQSLDNKPYITVDGAGNLFAADPESYRILQFTTQGEFVRYWGDYGSDSGTFDLPTSLSADPTGGVWVADTNNGRVMHFTLPIP
jgi:uncharacterized protein (TIGR03663 family)